MSRTTIEPVERNEPVFKLVDLPPEQMKEIEEGFAEMEANEEFLEKHWKKVKRQPGDEYIVAVDVGSKRVCKAFPTFEDARKFCDTHARGKAAHNALILPLDL